MGNSNPFYHWGANLGWIAMQEALKTPPISPPPSQQQPGSQQQ